MLFMTSTSMLVPVVGIITAPILARGLGVEGRGLAAAALAPQALIGALATLGLPDALTYLMAKQSQQLRRALLVTNLATIFIGLFCLVLTYAAANFLGGGNRELETLILFGAAFAIPQTLVNLLRGAATGLQMWRWVALERILASTLRLGALIALLFADLLTVRVAVIVLSLVPILAAIAYLPLLWRAAASSHRLPSNGTGKALMSYGSRVWLGSVASMLTGRVAQLLAAPLAGSVQLGLLVVAITISDVLFILVGTVRDTLFGLNAHVDDRKQLTFVARVAFLFGTAGALVLGATLPLWIVPVFGADFRPAVLPTWLLLLASVINIPGLMAGAGLSAWGRPGLRSASFGVAFLALLVSFVALVPRLGAVGAGLAGVISAIFYSGFSVMVAGRVGGLPRRQFLLLTADDVSRLRTELGSLLKRASGARAKADLVDADD